MLVTAIAALVICFAPAPLPRNTQSAGGYLGVEIKPAEGGVLVDLLYVGTPAEIAGITSGDVITSIDGRPVRNEADLVTALRKCKPNEDVPVVVRRDNELDQVETVTVKIAPKRAYCYLGATLNATRITGMPDNSPARAAGLQQGDLIRTVDGVTVNTSRELVAAINRRSPGETLPFVIDRNGEEKTVQVKIGTRPGY